MGKNIFLFRLVTLSIVVLFGLTPILAQTSFMDDPGIPAFTTGFPVENGFISLGNGNLHIEIPIATYPQRGDIRALHARLVYDSRFWILQTDPVSGSSRWTPNGIGSSGVNVGGGFRLITDGEPGNPTFSQSTQQCGTVNGLPVYKTTYSNYAYQEPNGTTHRTSNSFKLYLTTPGACGSLVPTGTTMAADNSGYEFVITNGNITIYAPDGTQVSPSVQDTNGNFYTLVASQNGTIQNVVDTLGRTVVIVTTSGSQVFLDYLCEPGSAGCNSANGNRARVTLNTSAPNWTTQFNQAGVGEYSAAGSALQSIVFPDGSQYQFQQDSYGMITSMTLPTGGQITYGYTNFADWSGNVNRWVTSRTVDGNTWTISPAFLSCATYPCTEQVTVTTPSYNDGSTTASDTHVYSFMVGSGWYNRGAWITQIQYFRGSASGTAVLTKTTDYPGSGPAVNSCPNAIGNGLTPVPIRETLTWPSGSGTLSKKVEYCYDTLANVTAKQMWDYQAGGNFAASPDREVDTTYITDSSYINANILRLPLTSTTLGAGTQVAQTTYAYDGGSLQPSGVTTHLTTPTGPRGNDTSISRWLSTGGNVTSSTAYYDTGEVYQAKDPLLNPSTYTYDSTGAYPSKVCNAKNQCSYSTFDFNTGLLSAFTDVNGSGPGDSAHTTTYTYDSMLRQLCTNFPDAGQTCASYPNPNNITQTKKVTSSLTDTSAAVFDDLGRVSETQHTLPTGVAKIDTTYDPVGAVATETNPYFTTSDPTYGVLQSFHDALGRNVKTVKQDGSVSSVSYAANCATGTDEAGIQRRNCHNGFGETIEVDETGDAFAGTPATGSLSISGTLRSIVTGGSPATPAQAIIAISGEDLNGDTGNITMTVGSASVTISYGYLLTAQQVAQSLASNLSSTQVTATASQVTDPLNWQITLQAIQAGSSGNSIAYSFSQTSFYPPGQYAPSYTFNPASGNLSGGQDAVGGTTTYDSGTVTVTFASGFTASACYGPNGNCAAVSGCPTGDSTAAQIACVLASPNNSNGLNRSGSPVSATVPSGSTSITLTYAVGTAGNGAVTATSAPTNPSLFPGGSFSGSTTLTGGQNPEGPSLDHNFFVTQYSYDALGNLLTVTQKGDPSNTNSSQYRVRTFTYDSLSRLLTATNPESGTISYSYDANGNLLQKTSPAPNQTGTATQVISYCYETLNRVTGRAYSAQTCTNGQLPAGTAVVSYTYDSGTNAIGHMTSLTDQAGSGSYTYDAMGRIKTEQRSIAGVTKNMSYTYNLDGSLNTITYPSSAVVTYTPWNNGTNAVGWASDAKDLGNGFNYATSGTFAPDGSLAGFLSGKTSKFAGISNSFSYNPRFQPINMSATFGSPLQTVFSINYDFHAGSGDNGNVWAIANNRDTTRNQTFTYDLLNRLSSAQNAGTDCSQKTLNTTQTKFWGNSYAYDAWGNLLQKTVTKCSAESLSVTAFANNQLSGYGYDAAGNMTSDPTDGVSSAAYDAENRIATATKNGVTTGYTYDDEGNRVKKSSGSTGTLYWYMSPGIVAESDLSGNVQREYIFFAGKRVARREEVKGSTGVFYYFSDTLKTASVITDASGNTKEDEDYYPWGGELPFVNSDSNHYKFTGKERDNETQLDYFGARYYSNGLGRFISADWSGSPEPVPYAGLDDPQSLNLYTYVRNTPVTNLDADGHSPEGLGSDDWLVVYSAIGAQPKPKPKPTPTPTPAPPPPPPPVLPPLPTFPIDPGDQPCEIDCGKIILDRGLNYLHDLFSGPKVNISPPPVAVDTVKPPNPLPPLRIIHVEPPLQGSGSYQDWNKKSTHEIIDSLGKDKKDGLKVYPDGAIANGNSRILILKERGVDVDNLPRDIINKTPVPEPLEPK